MSLTTGVYGAAGHSSVDVKDDDGSRAGTVRDDAGSSPSLRRVPAHCLPVPHTRMSPCRLGLIQPQPAALTVQGK